MINQMLQLIILIPAISFCQLVHNPVVLGFNGGNITNSMGVSSIATNPANLASSKIIQISPFLVANIGLKNNFFSIDTYNSINGADLEDPDADKYYNKESFINLFNNQGIRFNIGFSWPVFNATFKNHGISSNLVFLTDVGLPNAILEFLFNGNRINEKINLDVSQNLMVVGEVGYTYARKFKDFDIGVTVKPLLGLFHGSMETVKSSYFLTDTTSFVATGNYLISEAIGGFGTALDLGFTSHEFENGIKFGFVIKNMFGRIKWSQNHPLRSILEPTIKNLVPSEYYLRQNEFYFYNFSIEGLNGTNISKASELVLRNGYKVIKVEDLSKLPDDIDQERIVELKNGTYLIPSDSISDEQLGDYSQPSFITRYPSEVNFGLSKNYKEGMVIAYNLSTGFNNDFASYNNWKFTISSDIYKLKNQNIRLGLALGGKYKSSLGLGYGLKAGPIQFDIATAIRRGFTIYSMKGFDFSLGLSIVL